MAKVLHLPKEIRNDPKIQEVFGSPKAQPEARPKGNSNWKRDLYISWYRKREPRICMNPQCSRSFMPKVPIQRFCCRLCCVRFKHHIHISKYSCLDCGRHSHSLDQNKRCSFCREKESRFKLAIKEMDDRKKRRKITPKKYYCSKCGKPITESEHEIFHGLCALCEVAVHYERF